MERVRSSDPETSKVAAKAQDEKISASRARVLAMFKLYGDMTDKQLVIYIRDMEKAAGFKRLMSDSGARTRRSELSKANMERLRELRSEWYRAHPHAAKELQPHVLNGGTANEEEERALDRGVWHNADLWARSTLRVEGFRAPLWDTGKRDTGASRFPMIVWGLAS